MKYNDGSLEVQPAGEVLSYFEAGLLWRKERRLFDGKPFYKHTVSPDFQDERSTFWSADENRGKELLIRFLNKRGRR